MDTTSRQYYFYLVIFLGLLSAFGPFVIDMYLPALPEMTEVFRCDQSTVQLGLTFCMIGLALGQLLFGPASDKYGRKSVLVSSLIIFSGASIICCLSTSITAFTFARLLQGLGGAGGIVLSRSIAADLYSGRNLSRLIAILSAINNLAPITAPVIGGGIAHVWGWQGIFIILLVLGIVLLFMCIPLQESLTPNNKFSGNLLTSANGYKAVLRIKGFAAYSLIYAMSMAALFAYISATPFIVQDLFGLSEIQFALVFSVNAIALATGSILSLRVSTMSKAAYFGSIIGCTLSSVGLLVVLAGISNFFVYESLTFVMLFGIGLSLTGSTSQAMNLGRKRSGAASAVIGGIGYVAGGLVSPLVGVGNILVVSNLWCTIFLFTGILLVYKHRQS